MDSSTIDLCLSVFKWAKFRKAKGAVNLHTLLDLKTDIPVFIHISYGKIHDINTLYIIEFKNGAYYVMDKGYIDFARFY
ncbi:MAG: transposase [Prevotellaceae bacterium]|nr:transposase [Prevotellaceae bacterium]